MHNQDVRKSIKRASSAINTNAGRVKVKLIPVKGGSQAQVGLAPARNK